MKNLMCNLLGIFLVSIFVNHSYAESDKIIFQRGFQYQNQKQYNKAVEEYEKAIAINHNFFEAWISKGYSLSKLKKYEEAIKSFKEGVRINQSHHLPWWGLGESYSELGKFDESINCFDRAIENNPTDFLSIFLKGCILADFGEFEEAIITYDKVLEINPIFLDAWNLKGYSFKELKKYDDAKQAFSKAVKIKPENAIQWYSISISYYELGLIKKAINSFNKAISIDPECGAKKYKAWIMATCPYKEYRDGESALKIIEDIQHQQPNSKNYEVLAAIYAEIGDFQKAIFFQEKEIARLREKRREKIILKTNLISRLKQYKNNTPYREYPVSDLIKNDNKKLES